MKYRFVTSTYVNHKVTKHYSSLYSDIVSQNQLITFEKIVRRQIIFLDKKEFLYIFIRTSQHKHFISISYIRIFMIITHSVLVWIMKLNGFFCFTIFFGCCFIKYIDRTYCKVRENVFGTVSEMSANSCALVFYFTDLLSVYGHSMFGGIPVWSI